MESMSRDTQLQKELSELLNRHSEENRSDTPDFILAAYLINCLNAYNSAVNAREKWYGRPESRMGNGNLPG